MRDRFRRSEAAWTALADRAERSEQMKTAELLKKAGEAPELLFDPT